jgi:hypothetical protein
VLLSINPSDEFLDAPIIYCLAFSAIFFISGELLIIFSPPLKTPKTNVCHPNPIIDKINTAIIIHVSIPITK